MPSVRGSQNRSPGTRRPLTTKLIIIWVDAQLSPVIAGWLTEHLSIESWHVGSLGLLAASDLEIFDAARAAGTTILTKDRDFLDLVQRHGSPPFIIWITCGNTSNTALIRILRGAILTACESIESDESIVEIGERLPHAVFHSQQS